MRMRVPFRRAGDQKNGSHLSTAGRVITRKKGEAKIFFRQERAKRAKQKFHCGEFFCLSRAEGSDVANTLKTPFLLAFFVIFDLFHVFVCRS
jgi:hypothetical protein